MKPNWTRAGIRVGGESFFFGFLTPFGSFPPLVPALDLLPTTTYLLPACQTVSFLWCVCLRASPTPVPEGGVFGITCSEFVFFWMLGAN